MSDHFVTNKQGQCCAVYTILEAYFYKGYTFEFARLYGPVKLKKDGEVAARQGRKFYKAVDEWNKLTKEEKQKTRI
jgi:hypothetical protein